ncbi:imidazole glycerol phosphate synthase [Priestia taiwanensis]|uniref:DUF4190 domain-containing protein n=1 Tax=Priestia taiwanensis TaxID=1347902 RepID=A0A917ER60_9BACI|nr:imidazole glycerol phosphate synthase [Priestia taiwanensis]MBM7364645.1 membrane-anchored protein YejM (alkaline phosphatase superfamily) [Priestia taiwanensis]GGE78501.1 hypothetical protein GCM10007140_30110 [Priestia taiwanensis]
MAKHDRNKFGNYIDDEEYGAELSPTDLRYDDNREVNTSSSGTFVGFIALALAVIGMFTYPVFFGIAAVVLGIYAVSRNSRTTGMIAIVLGAIVAIAAIFFRVAILTFLFSLF